MKDYYKILEICRNASQDEIKKAYRKMAKKYHPDTNSNMDQDILEEKMKEINTAYEILSDVIKKRDYDLEYDAVMQEYGNFESYHREQEKAKSYQQNSKEQESQNKENYTDQNEYRGERTEYKDDFSDFYGEYDKYTREQQVEEKGLGWYCSIIVIYIVFCMYPAIGIGLWVLRLIQSFFVKPKKIVSTLVLAFILWASFDAVIEQKNRNSQQEKNVENQTKKGVKNQENQTNTEQNSSEEEKDENIKEVLQAKENLYQYLNQYGKYIPEQISFERMTERGFLFRGYDTVNDQVVTSFLYSVDFDGTIYDELNSIYVAKKRTEAEAEYILPYSDSMYYSYYQLRQLTKQQLRFARNEIFARYGYVFQDEQLQNYFSQCSWYVPTGMSSEEIESYLNSFERENLKLIQQCENE